MNWKKNVFSYGLWAVYLSAAGTLLACIGIDTGRMLGLNTLFGIGVAVLLFLGAAVLFLGGQKLSGFLEGWKTKGEHTFLMAEGLAVIGLFAVGILLRVSNISYAGEEASYYDTAKIVEGQGIPQVAHGAVYFYLELLHVLFLLVGNKWIAGIWLQIGLQLIACVLLYLGVRKLTGRVPSVIMTAFLMLAPQSIADGIMYSPRMMYLCIYAVGLLCAAVFLDQHAKGEIKFGYDMVLLFLAGVLFALIGYLDITGWTLFVFLISVFWMNKNPKGNIWGSSILQLAVIVLGTAAGFAGALFLDAFASGKSVGGVFKAWYSLYLPQKADMLSIWGQTGDYIVYLILSVLLTVGIFSFWCRREYERISPWILTVVVFLTLEIFQITVPEISSNGYLLYLLAVIAGISVTDCLIKCEDLVKAVSAKKPSRALQESDGVQWLDEEDETEQIVSETVGTVDSRRAGEDEIKEKPEPVKKVRKKRRPAASKGQGEQRKTDENANAIDNSEIEITPASQINFIENPLPLPKRHMKKIMDYGFEPSADKMKYDIEVKDDDNFDII